MLKPIQTSVGHKRFQSRCGMTLIEVMISMLAASIILAAILAITAFVSRSFIAIGNYIDLDRASRNALDVMSRDIRNARQLSAYNTNSITLIDQNNTSFTYSWDPVTLLFTRSTGGASKVLLKDCDTLTFHIYQRNPTNDFQFVPAPAPNQAKLIDVSWRCSRSILGAIINSESVQTAKIVIRN